MLNLVPPMLIGLALAIRCCARFTGPRPFRANFVADVGPARTDGIKTQATPCHSNGYCTYRTPQPLNGRTIEKHTYGQ